MLEGDTALERSEELGLQHYQERARDAPNEGTLSHLPQHWSEGLGSLKAKLSVSCT